MSSFSCLRRTVRDVKRASCQLYDYRQRRGGSCGAGDVHPVGKKEPAKAVVLGYYSDNDGNHGTAQLTPSGKKYDKIVCGRLEDLLRYAGPAPRLGEYRIFHDLEPMFTNVVVVGLGKECAGYNEDEQLDEGKENIRIAAAVGSRVLQEIEAHKIYVEGFGHTESAAEGAAMSLWIYQELKNPDQRKKIPTIELHDDCDWTGWQIGLQKAAAQNLTRQLMETPSNRMTPIIFAQTAVEVLCKSGVNVEVQVQSWAESQGMGGFVAVSKGSCEPPIFLEISYYGTGNLKDRPIVLIGKGTTFDSGGLCLRPPEELHHARGDLLGAASVVATCRAIAALQLPINIRGLIPLCEHMPGCSAMRPGDIVTAHNGKGVYVHDTRYEGQLVVADALSYAQVFWPRFVVDVASMTRDCLHAISSSASGVWTNSEGLWNHMKMAAVHTGDRVWRFPLWNHYRKKVATSSSVDLKVRGRAGPGGDSCRAASFLKEFVPCGEWLHMDTFNVMRTTGEEIPYLRPGMSGRPTRTLIEFVSQLVCKQGDDP